MKSSFFLIFIISSLLITSCTTHNEYPKNWGNFQSSGSKNCVNISGIYENFGIVASYNYKPNLSSALFPDYNLSKKITHVSFFFENDEILVITLWEKRKAIHKVTLQNKRNEFQCENGFLKIKTTEFNAQGLVAAKKWNVLTFSKVKNDLILKISNSGVGTLLLIIPIAGGATIWKKFEKFKTIKEALNKREQALSNYPKTTKYEISESELESCIRFLNSDQTEHRIFILKRIFANKYTDNVIFPIINKMLINRNIQQNLPDSEADEISWLCKVLASSGRREYEGTIKYVYENSQNNKVRKYAKQSLRILDDFEIRNRNILQ